MEWLRAPFCHPDVPAPRGRFFPKVCPFQSAEGGFELFFKKVLKLFAEPFEEFCEAGSNSPVSKRAVALTLVLPLNDTTPMMDVHHGTDREHKHGCAWRR